MNFEDTINDKIKGIFTLQIVDAITGDVIEEDTSRNIIVIDSREAITRSISGNAGSYTINTLKIGDDIGESMTGTPLVTFSNSNPDTISRNSGSWLSDGFAAGKLITVRNTIQNDGEYTINTVTDTTITLIGTDTLTSEGSVSGAYITTGTEELPENPLNTYDETTMEVVYVSPNPLSVGYPDTQSVGFNVTINGADLMSYYPGDNSKIFTSAALHVSGGQVFAYKRFSKKSISSLVNIVVSWILTY